MEYKFRVLRKDEIDCRVAACTDKGFQLLLYKDARCDMNILDETIGCFNWSRDHREIKGNMYCGVAIYCDERKEWVIKWDCGVESNTEKEKGESSDSFKRACFNWGIGRELYTSPFIWIEGNTKFVRKDSKTGKDIYAPTIRDYRVAEIGYTDDRVINALKIEGKVNGVWQSIYEMGKKVNGGNSLAAQGKQNSSADGGEMTLEQAKAFKTAKGTLLGNLSEEYLQKIIENTKSPQLKKAAEMVLDDKLSQIDDDMLPIDDGDLPF